MDKLLSGKSITCIFPKGPGRKLSLALKSEKDVIAVYYHAVRGESAMAEQRGARGIGESEEKDVLTVVVSPERADDIFEFIYHEAGIGKAHGGFMFQGNLTGFVPLTLPELPEEE